MAYLTWYIDPDNGTDANPATLTNCVASNPSGTTTRINKTAHGLTTGQIVRATNFSAWLNLWWTVTVIDADNFNLDGAVWQTTADATGDIAPNNGYSWATAYKNITFLNNSTNRTQEIRVAKSQDPVSLGNATWTNKSPTVTLATAQTLNIDLCNTAWTAANGATSTTTTNRKEGTNAISIITPAATAVTTKYAYKNLGTTLNLSAYDAISLYISPISTGISTNTRYVIKLCSDTLGDTAVDTFDIPAVLMNSGYTPLVLKRNGGGNLGNNIQSISWYTGTVSPGNSNTVYIDNIFGCSSTGLNSQSLISKNSSAAYDHTKDPWYPIASINGTNVQLDRGSLTDPTSRDTYAYYTSGTSPQTTTTYYRNTFKFNPSVTSSSNIVTFGLNNNQQVELYGGWNKSTNTQDGITFFDGLIRYGRLFVSTSSTNSAPVTNVLIKDIGAVRYNEFMLNNSSSYFSYTTLERVYIIAMDNSVVLSQSDQRNWVIKNVTINSFSNSCGIGGYFNTIDNLRLSTIINTVNFVVEYSTITNVEVYNIIQQSGFGFVFNPKYSKVDNLTIDANGLGDSTANDSSALRIGSASLPSDNTRITNLTIKNAFNAIGSNGAPGFIRANGVTLSGNTYTFGGQYRYEAYLSNVTWSDSNYFRQRQFQPTTVTSLPYTNIAYISNINGNADNNRAYFGRFNTTSESSSWLTQTTVRKTASGVAWQMNILNTLLDTNLPERMKIATVAVNANSQVTVKAWVKLSHATDIGARIIVPKLQLPGISSDVIATKSNDTNWEELTVSFTPTTKGAVDVYLEGFWKANLADESVYVDDITVTQA